MEKSRWSAILLTAVLAASPLTGCSGTPSTPESKPESTPSTVSSADQPASAGDGYAWEKNKGTPVKLSVYYPDPGSAWETWGKDPTSKRLEEMTGISFTVVAPVTSDDQKLSLMIASDELPDLILNYYNEPTWGDMVNNKQLADMEVLTDKYAPKLKELISPTAWEYARRDDGKVYNVTTWIRSPEQQKWVTDNHVIIGTNQPVIQMRQDYFKEIGSPEIKNADEFMAAMEQVKAKHPDAIAFYGGDGSFLKGPGPMSTHFGIGSFYEKDGVVSQSYRNPKYLEMYKWMNKMASKGLLTKESFVDTTDVSVGKTKQGLPAAYTWTVGETGKVPANNPNTSYQPMKAWDSYKQIRMNAGYFSFAVAAKSKNQERVMNWIEFINTEEGAKASTWGIEGEAYGDVENGPHFRYINGEPKFFKEFLDAKIADWSGTCRKSGLDSFRECMVNDVMGDKVAWDSSDPLIGKMNEWYGDKVEYQDQFIFNVPSGSEEMVVNQKIKDLIKEYNVKWVFAKDETEVTSLYNEFIAKVESAGEATLNKLYTVQWTANKARLGI